VRAAGGWRTVHARVPRTAAMRASPRPEPRRFAWSAGDPRGHPPRARLRRGFFAWGHVTNASRAGAAFAGLQPQAAGEGRRTGDRGRLPVQITTDLLPTNCSLQSPIPPPRLQRLARSLRPRRSATSPDLHLQPDNAVSSPCRLNLPVTTTTVTRSGQARSQAAHLTRSRSDATPAPTPVPTVAPCRRRARHRRDPDSAARCDAPAMTGATVSADVGLDRAGVTGGSTSAPTAPRTLEGHRPVPAFRHADRVRRGADITAKK